MNPIEPVPVADATADPQAPTTTPVAADAFAALLAAAAALGPPPTSGQAQAARTAPAEGTTAGSDSPGSSEKLDAIAPSSATATPFASPASGTPAASATPATPTNSQAYAPATGSIDEDTVDANGAGSDLPVASQIDDPASAADTVLTGARPQGHVAAADAVDREYDPPPGQPDGSGWMPLDVEQLRGEPATAPEAAKAGNDIPVSFSPTESSGPAAPAGDAPARSTGSNTGGIPIAFSRSQPSSEQVAAASTQDAHAPAPPQPASNGPKPANDTVQPVHPASSHGGSRRAKGDHVVAEQTQRVEPATAAATGTERGPLAETQRTESEPVVVRPVTARLHELVDRTKATIRVAVRDGRTDARITLRPAELGEVRITLRYEGGGVSALMTADSSKAVELLSQASADLRRSLEQQGLSVHGLDVRLAGDDARQGTAAWRGATPAPARLHRHADDDHDQQPQSIDQQGRLGEPGRIDVLA